jgi:hypothetical protein
VTDLSPLRRPYSVPELVVHGTVQTLTRGKTGTDADLDGTGSFIPRDVDGQAPSDS